MSLGSKWKQNSVYLLFIYYLAKARIAGFLLVPRFALRSAKKKKLVYTVGSREVRLLVYLVDYLT